ncbi:MAG: hypothetical protein LW863_18955, partial [Flammeovirgaceae bacterium]|nr:hypothetical protein [Flammeovirgaceae bacterium]
MIVIATNQFDASSSDVMGWLDGESVLRINSDNFQTHAQANQVNHDFSRPLTSIDSIWFRKGSKVKFDLENENDQLLRHCTDELIALN